MKASRIDIYRSDAVYCALPCKVLQQRLYNSNDVGYYSNYRIEVFKLWEHNLSEKLAMSSSRFDEQLKK